MAIHCSNCYNMKVTFVPLKEYQTPHHKCECKYNYHKKEKEENKRTSPRSWFQVWLVKDASPPNPHSCKDYISMGVNEVEFLESLPSTKQDYTEIWRY